MTSPRYECSSSPYSEFGRPLLDNGIDAFKKFRASVRHGLGGGFPMQGSLEPVIVGRSVQKAENGGEWGL
jgi:hypothetical protein